MKTDSCATCGEHLDPGWDTCPACTSPVVEDNTCHACGKALKPAWRLCPYCKAPQIGAGSDFSHGNPLWSLGADMNGGAAGQAMGPQPELAPGTELMHFRIESLLGKGASSAVYRAENTLLGEAVALKVVASFESDHPLLGAYRDEYKAQLSITNKAHILHIEAPLLCAHQDLTWLMLPMELARESLRDWKKRHPVGEEQRLEQGLELFDQACDGVHALHEQGLVHLDIKPENILLTGSEDSPVVKVADFGLSRSMSRQDQRGSLFGDGIGTPAYMAPEQILAARWKDVGKEADIYALGMILYELLDGDLPYSGSAEQIKAKKRDASIVISTPKGQEQLVKLAMKCLKREKKERPNSIDYLLQILEDVELTKSANHEANKPIKKESKLSGNCRISEILNYYGLNSVNDRPKEFLYLDSNLEGGNLLNLLFGYNNATYAFYVEFPEFKDIKHALDCLLEAGIEIVFTDKLDETPIHQLFAVFERQYEVTKYDDNGIDSIFRGIVEKGGVNISEIHKQSIIVPPIVIEESRRYGSLVRLRERVFHTLISYNYDINICDSKNRNVLKMLFFYQLNFGIEVSSIVNLIKRLEKYYGLNLMQKDNFGRTIKDVVNDPFDLIWEEYSLEASGILDRLGI